jgi:hypothetical protein
MSSRRPTFEDIRGEQRGFIGPPAPPQIPKFTPEGEREAVHAMRGLFRLSAEYHSKEFLAV